MVFIWKITERCNLDCLHCYVGSPQKKLKIYDFPEENIPIFFQFIEKFGKILHRKPNIIFHGGEPFVRGERFFEKVYNFFTQLKQKMPFVIFECSIQTNFLLYNKHYNFYISDLFQKRIGTSWDGTMSPYRRHPNYDIIWYYKTLRKNIELLKTEISDVKMGILVLLNEYNIREDKVSLLIKEILQLYPSSIRLNIIHNSPLLNKKFVVDQEKLFNAIKLIYEEIKSLNSQIRIFPIDDMLISIKTGYSVNCPFLWNCPVGFMLIRSDGSIGNCDEYGLKDIITGSIYSSDPIELLSKKTEIAYKRYKNIKESECKGCEFIFYCQGGCMMRSLMYKGDPFKKDPLCDLYKKIFTWLIKEN